MSCMVQRTDRMNVIVIVMKSTMTTVKFLTEHGMKLCGTVTGWPYRRDD